MPELEVSPTITRASPLSAHSTHPCLCFSFSHADLGSVCGVDYGARKKLFSFSCRLHTRQSRIVTCQGKGFIAVHWLCVRGECDRGMTQILLPTAPGERTGAVPCSRRCIAHAHHGTLEARGTVPGPDWYGISSYLNWWPKWGAMNAVRAPWRRC